MDRHTSHHRYDLIVLILIRPLSHFDIPCDITCKLVILASHATPQGYNLPTPSGPGLLLDGSSSGFISGSSSSGHGNDGGTSAVGGCKVGEILHVDGTCVVPVITRNIFLYDAPKQTEEAGGTFPSFPPPKVDHNIIFVRLPKGEVGTEPVIVPPPRQENIIYVLNKSGGSGGQRVIEVTAPPPSNPEVYFVTYGDGENPTLPIGVDLETALSVATEAGGQAFGGASVTGDGFGGKVGSSGSGGNTLIGSTSGSDSESGSNARGSEGSVGFGINDEFGGERSSYSDTGFEGTGFDSGFQAGVVDSDDQYGHQRDTSLSTPSSLYSGP
ncbi:uncharacterized protein LOC134770728 [Penaeus indicus]|uniref:uncharacterized protein LOC134770728 n=1 Tax=Penaeus indicus TaxID=29960 RepID=UPI00300D615F